MGTVLTQRLVTLVQHFLGRHLERVFDDAWRELDARKAGPLAELIQHERQTATPITTLQAAQGIAGAREGPVAVDLAEYLVFVGAQQVDGEIGHVEAGTVRARLPVESESQVAEVGDEAEGRKRLSAARDDQRPFER